MSAQINTVSGTIYEDFIVKMMGIKVTELTASVIMKCIAVISGVICVILVFVVEKLNGILQVYVLNWICDKCIVKIMYDTLFIIDVN